MTCSNPKTATIGVINQMRNGPVFWILQKAVTPQYTYESVYYKKTDGR